MPKHWISLLVLVVLTIMFVVFWESPPAILSGPKPEAKAEFPSAYMLNSRSRQYDSKGKLKFELKADKVVHYQAVPGRQAANDFANIEAPELTLYSGGSSPWHLSAKQGRSNFDGSKLTLKGDVYGWQTNSDKGRNELNTDQLVIHTVRNYVETDKAVMIRTAGHSTKAIGLRADLNKETLQLRSKVRGVHEFKK